ncbi:hypothetical protein VDF98_21560 [Xanthomonas campestris pv. raphani]|uniref:hypothetical protein n=1 Tax=Xanthomonas campestris TaxID=339 RepID=UPI0023679E7A|nr:hypothetical protein [Xanthomonas campestris]MEA9825988.1 hypothetical protein [Xanthomonas campestris pv. raphani]MEA9854287.1 hypothetical protein [Xanthomonas campestris pv. raphani]MEA9858479.1 hypothetical protein [Xanthomonas campestris pv. raphani]MEA9967458.1 hypothetical protein [Xanthomonas campestris pv. raphani]WDJ23028.1 hypothetical protein JH270_03390 [Xanthomonas campestris pv. raphani]
MRSYRWYALTLGGEPLSERSINVLLERLDKQEFWFVFDDISSSQVSGKFSYRYPLVLGQTEINSSENELVELISSVEFVMFNGVSSSVLRLSDGGRHAKRLLSALADIFGFGFSIHPLITLDAGKIVGVNFGDFDEFRMVGLKVINVRVSDGVIARMEFASRYGMLISDIRDLDFKDFRIESVKYEVLKDGLKGAISATSSGRVVLGGKLAPMLVNVLDRALLQ